MTRRILWAKIHRVAVTECELEYEGSLTLDADLLRAAHLVPFERIEVWNVTNGNRFATYLIEGEAGSGVCCVNGAAAHKVDVGHKLILAAYADIAAGEIAAHRPHIVLVGERNRISETKRSEGAGVRFTA